jgi:hypothetical protein
MRIRLGDVVRVKNTFTGLISELPVGSTESYLLGKEKGQVIYGPPPHYPPLRILGRKRPRERRLRRRKRKGS